MQWVVTSKATKTKRVCSGYVLLVFEETKPQSVGMEYYGVLSFVPILGVVPGSLGSGFGGCGWGREACQQQAARRWSTRTAARSSY